MVCWPRSCASSQTTAPERRLAMIEDRLRQDPRRIRVAGLFGADGRRIAGNIESLPSGLTPNVPANAAVVRVDNRGRETQKVRLAARSLPSGEVLVIGRNIDELAEIAEIVEWALALGLLPAFGSGGCHRNGFEPACSRSARGSQPKNPTYRGRRFARAPADPRARRPVRPTRRQRQPNAGRD